MPSHPTPDRVPSFQPAVPSPSATDTASQLDLLKRYATARQHLAELRQSPALFQPDQSWWEAESVKARNLLILANRGLVASFLQPYRNLGLETEDLMQEGLVGLSKAIENFDLQRGFQLSTFATCWIRQSITRALSKQSRTVRIPEERLTEIRRVRSTAEHLEKSMGHPPTHEDIARAMGKTVRRIESLLEDGQAMLSIDAPVGAEDGSPLQDLLEDPSQEHPGQSLDRTTIHHWLQEGCRTLTDREYQVIELKFGLGQKGPMPLESIGERLSLSRQRISQIAEAATTKLRQFLMEKESPKAKACSSKRNSRPALTPSQLSRNHHVAPRLLPSPSSTRTTADLHVMQPPSCGTLAIRSVTHNPNHHLWNNNGTWFCKFRIKANDGTIQKINQSLRTRCVEDARLRRDELMQAFQSPLGHAA